MSLCKQCFFAKHCICRLNSDFGCTFSINRIFAEYAKKKYINQQIACVNKSFTRWTAKTTKSNNTTTKPIDPNEGEWIELINPYQRWVHTHKPIQYTCHIDRTRSTEENLFVTQNIKCQSRRSTQKTHAYSILINYYDCCRRWLVCFFFSRVCFAPNWFLIAQSYFGTVRIC